jgi:hypothetical protein
MGLCNPGCNNDPLTFLREQLRVYNATLSGFSVYIPFHVHKLPIVKGYQVYDPWGNEVEIQFTRAAERAIQVDSNILLDGHHIILF